MAHESKKPITIQKDDQQFQNFRATCDTVFKKLLADGVGALVKHHTAFTPEEDKLWEAGIFGTTHPQALQNAFFYVGKYLCLRGGEEHRNLTRSQFIDIPDGFKYVEHGSKTFRGGFNQVNLPSKNVTIYRDENAGPRCLCTLLTRYRKRLPNNNEKTNDIFYLKPLGPHPTKPSFAKVPVEKNKLNAMMKRICEAAGLPPMTNHSLRITGATTLFSKNVPEKLV